MSKKLAIRGHLMRGKEVIELLEMMGGKNIREHKYDGSSNMHGYYIVNDIILNDRLSIIEDDDFIIFTLEEFLEKFPYKVGDKVNSPCKGCVKTITSMEWDEYLDTVSYKLDNKIYTRIEQLKVVNDLPYKEEVSMKDNKLFGTLSNPVETKSYAVGLKDGKVIECGVNKETDMNKIKPLFKAGDVVKLKGCPDKNIFWIVMDVIEDGYIFNGGEKCSFDDQHHYEKSNREVINAPDITAKVTDKNHKMGPKSKLPSKYYEEIQTKRDIDKSEFIIKHMILPNKMDDKLEYEIIDGYEFDKVENNKIILKPIKPKYPTTYAECCEVLVGRKPKPNEISFDKMELCLVDLDNTQNIDFQNPYLSQFNSLFRLRMCRDAYWKIYGEETELGKPWEPNWKNTKNVKYGITLYDDIITKIYLRNENAILAFPTEEMRDIFFDNFKNLIEECKELL